MADGDTCSRCGTPLAGRMSGGLCSACLFKVMLGPVEHEEQAPRAAEGLATLSGRYRLGEIIGEGGFGTVHAAEQLEPVRRQVAVKILKPGMDSRRVIARFEAERQALALMEHPHIAHVFDAGTTETGRPFFVMELVRGVPITEYCRRHALDPWTRLHLFMQVCSAIQHAHQKGIIHRDLKPTNILVAPSDNSAAAGVPKVIDFGIAKVTGEFRLTEETLQTHFHQFLGTPAYMSPEQADLKGIDIDTRSDIYSLGVLLYELLAGVTPFETEELLRSGLNEMCRVIREQEPPRPSRRLTTAAGGPVAWKAEQRREFISAVRGDLDWVVMKCLEKDRTRRYASASDLAADIRRHLQHEPVAARAPSTAYRIQKYVRRHRLFVVAAAAVVVSLLGGLLTSLALLVREQHARTRAVAAEVAQDRLRRTAEEARAEVAQANRRLAADLRQRDWRRAEELVAAGKRSDALALWARLLREQPDDTALAARLLSALSQRSFAVPRGPAWRHDAMVTVVQFSPRGDRVLTASDDGLARLWDAKGVSAAPLRTLQTGASRAGVFNADGIRVLLGGADGRVRIWNTEDGRQIADLGGKSPLPAPAGSRVAIFGHSRNVTFWNTDTGAEDGNAFRTSGEMRSIAWHPDGRSVVIGGGDGRLRTWDPAAGQLVREAEPLDGAVRTLVISPDGTRLLAGTTRGVVSIQDALTGTEIRRFEERGREVLLADISPDSRWTATYHYGQPPRLWDLQSGELLGQIGEDAGVVLDLKFSPDSRKLAVALQTGIGQLWEVATREICLEPIEHDGPIAALAFSPDGRTLATASQDGTARLWDVRMNRPEALTWPVGGRLVGAAQLDRAGRRLLVAAGSAARVFDSQTGEALTLPFRHSYKVQQATLSPDERLVATASVDKSVKLWDAATGEPVGQPMVHSAEVWDVSFSPDGRQLATACRDHYLRVFDVETQRLLRMQHQPSEILRVRFSADGNRILTACVDGGLRLHSPSSLELVLPPMRHKGIVWTAEFSPDGTRLLSTSADRTAQLWNAETGQPIGNPMRHPKGVQMGVFSADGRRVATGSEDGTARVWDALTGEPVSPPLRRPNPAALNAIRFSPDSRWLLTMDLQGAYLWDVQTGLSISEAMMPSGEVNRACFHPDGTWFWTFSGAGMAQAWKVVASPSPVARWLPDLAEGLAGRRLDARGELLPAPPEGLLELRERLLAAESNDFYSRWGQWFFRQRLEGGSGKPRE